jgi:PTS system nitrogen regulatory IIA component
MRLTPFLRRELVVAGLQAGDNVEVIEGLVDLVCAVEPSLERVGLLAALLEREQQVSTGLESGVAVPHATVAGIDGTLLAVARLAKPVDFATLDGSLVRFVFLMISPPSGLAVHIRLLARIARLCALPAFLEAMDAAQDDAGLFQVIEHEDDQHV